MAVSPAIRFYDVTVAYGRHPALHRLSGGFDFGSMTAVAGPNGAGKSTLVKALMAQLPPSSGRIDLGGLSANDFGYLPQAAEIDRSFPLTVADTVMLGAWRLTGPFRAVSKAIAERARKALDAVGLAGFERRSIGALSAGQFQRVLFARLLLQDAKVIVLDEPFNGIDARTTRDLMALLKGWHSENRTIIAVLHDLEQVKAHFPQTLLIAREPVAWGPTEAVMTTENLVKARALSEAWDENAAVCERAEQAA